MVEVGQVGKTQAPSKRRPANPPRHQHGFVRITHRRCLSCEDREALKNEGRPIVISGGSLRGSRSVGLSTRAHGCEVCGGTGSIPVDPQSVDSIDPYALKPASKRVKPDTSAGTEAVSPNAPLS